jgi:predicted neutral ceramidase superfamily lipid hydrolase
MLKNITTGGAKMKKKRTFFSLLYLLYPTILFWLLANFAQTSERIFIFLHAVMIIGSIAFSIIKPCKYKMLIIGSVLPPVSFLIWGFIRYTALPETLTWGLPFTFLFFLIYTIPYLTISSIINSIVNKIKSKKDSSFNA